MHLEIIQMGFTFQSVRYPRALVALFLQLYCTSAWRQETSLETFLEMFLELFLQAIKTCTGLLLPHNSWGWGVVSRATSSLVPRPTWPGNDVNRYHTIAFSTTVMYGCTVLTVQVLWVSKTLYKLKFNLKSVFLRIFLGLWRKMRVTRG